MGMLGFFRLPSEGRLLLYAQRFIFLFITILIAGIFAIPTLLVCAQTSDFGSANFVGIKQSDRVGSNGAFPDGKADAVFHLTLKQHAGESFIKRIELHTTAGRPGRWSSTLGKAGVGYLGVARSKRTSFVLNRDGGSLSLNPKDGRDFLLFVTDDGAFAQPDRRYEVVVYPLDGKPWRIPVGAEAQAEEPKTAEVTGDVAVRMSGVLKGISRYDAVNSGKTMTGDDKADGLFVLSVEAKRRVITAIQIKNVGGTAAVWDTLPDSGNGAIGVALVSDPVRLLNKRDGTVLIDVKDRVDLNLYVADNGSIAGDQTDFRVTVTFYDGSLSWCQVEREHPVAAPSRQPERQEEVPPKQTREETSQVKFLGTWKGTVATDAVGKYPGLNPDGAADALFGLDIEVVPSNFITGIEIRSMVDPNRKWATGGSSSGAWGLAVARQGEPKMLLNQPDGAIRIPINGRDQFNLYAADPGGLAMTSQSMRVIVHLADGSSYQQFVRRPVSLTTSSVIPNVGEVPRARGLVTCEFRGFIADLVNRSTRPAKDGYLDGTFIMRVKAEDKTISRINIKDGDGVIRWSSDAKAPMMFLGVALYPKIYNLINRKGGSLNVKIPGRKTVYLYAADNGLLSDASARLSLEVILADKSTLVTDVIK